MFEKPNYLAMMVQTDRNEIKQSSPTNDLSNCTRKRLIFKPTLLFSYVFIPEKINIFAS